MIGLSISGLNFPRRIGNKAAFQQARMVSRQALSRIIISNSKYRTQRNSPPKRLISFEWSNINFAIDKALSKIRRKDKF